MKVSAVMPGSIASWCLVTLFFYKQINMSRNTFPARIHSQAKTTLLNQYRFPVYNYANVEVERQRTSAVLWKLMTTWKQ